MDIELLWGALCRPSSVGTPIQMNLALSRGGPQLEKLCRYVTRPAISLERFEVRPDGMVSWLLRKAWRDGTQGFVMKPYQFLARLAAIVPHPREHQLTYQGVLAPASSLRDQVVPRPVVRKEPKDVDVADEDG